MQNKQINTMEYDEEDEKKDEENEASLKCVKCKKVFDADCPNAMEWYIEYH